MADLSSWRAEIESLTGGRVITVPVETDRAENVLRIPPEFPGREVVRGLLLDERFVRQFIRAHAMNVNYNGAGYRFHFILVNLALRDDWGGKEEAVLAHEYGHIWLNTLGFRSPTYSGEGCVITVAGDVVQHPLIFAETRKRGFDYHGFWIRNFERWLKQDRPNPDACQKLILLSHWLDASVSLTDADWPDRARVLSLLDREFPQIKPAFARLSRLLTRVDLWDRSLYEASLTEALRVLRSLHQGETLSMPV